MRSFGDPLSIVEIMKRIIQVREDHLYGRRSRYDNGKVIDIEAKDVTDEERKTRRLPEAAADRGD